MQSNTCMYGLYLHRQFFVKIAILQKVILFLVAAKERDIQIDKVARDKGY